jgi:hypothetical protein
MRARTILSGIIVVWFAVCVFYLTDAAVDLVPLYALLGSVAAFSVIWFGMVAAVIAARRENRLSAAARSRTRLLIALTAAIALVATLAVADAGLAVRTRLSAPALLRASCTSRGRIGLFYVRELECAGECRRFITARNFLDDAGVAFCPTGRPPVLGEDSYRHLFGGWWRWNRSW